MITIQYAGNEVVIVLCDIRRPTPLIYKIVEGGGGGGESNGRNSRPQASQNATH